MVVMPISAAPGELRPGWSAEGKLGGAEKTREGGEFSESGLSYISSPQAKFSGGDTYNSAENACPEVSG